jgi:S1-C subfamily serine protease
MNARLAALLAVGLAAPAGAFPATDLVELCIKVRPAFVFVEGGSGVVVRPDGLVLTNDHVIEGKRSYTVRLGDGSSFRAKLLGTDPYGDLAALQLELKEGQTVPHLELGDSDALAVGDETLAVGNPFGLGVLDQAPTFTAGIVSALNHTQGSYTECIVTDTEVNPGNSGGPLVDMSGRVVGINGQISTRFGLRSNTGLGFAISAKQIKLWLPRLEAAGGGEVKHGRIPGLGFAGGAAERPESVQVKDVAEGSAAAAAGFKPGDLILRLDDAPVANGRRLAAILGIYPEGHDVQVTVQRDGAEAVLQAKLVAPKRCQVGMRLVRPRGADFTPRLAEVEDGTPAAAGGLRVGDEIVAVNGRQLELRSKQEFRAFDRSLRTQFNEGDIFTFKVRRVGGEGQGAEELDIRVVAK